MVQIEGLILFVAVLVKLVWTSNRSMSQTTRRGGFSRSSR